MNAKRPLWLSGAALAALALTSPLVAQELAAAGSRPVVQPLPDAAATRLAEGLRALAREPRSVPLLVQAGDAALALDDVTAADGFFKRAQAIDPADGRVLAGMAGVLVRQEQPVEALRLYAQAEQTGAPMIRYLGDRGLAYDLVGDNARAQQDYQRSLAAQSDPVVSRRLALSQAIAGNQPAAETTLLPMLRQTDLAAFRTRAFALAIAGKPDEAVSIAETMLPERISSRLAPYLRFMPRLTRAQQAAAANLGRFPQADRIGKDSPEVAALSAAAAPALPKPQPAAAPVLAAAEPVREPPRSRPRLTARSNQRDRQAEGRSQPRLITPTPMSTPAPAPVTTAAAATAHVLPVPALAAPKLPASNPVQVAAAAPQGTGPAPQVAAVVPVAQSPVAPRPLPSADQAARSNSVLATSVLSSSVLDRSVLESSEPERAPATAPVRSAAPVVVARLDQASPGAAPAAVPEPAPTPAPQPVAPAPEPAPPPPRDLRQAFADFGAATAAPAAAAVQAGAVNMATFQPRREAPPPKPEVAKPAPAKPAPPPKPVIPSRHWVQIATGRDLGALGFDWRRLKREAGGLLDKHQPQYADWGQTNRLIVGPFASAREAEQFVGKLKDKKLDAFRFTSDQGEEVKPLK